MADEHQGFQIDSEKEENSESLQKIDDLEEEGANPVGSASNPESEQVIKGEEIAEYERFEEIFKETKANLRELQIGKSKARAGSLEYLEKVQRRAISLGIDIVQTLVDFTLCRVHNSQIKKQISLSRWILERSIKKNSEVFYLIDFLLYTAEELARQKIDADAKIIKEGDLSEEGISEEERIRDELSEKCVKAISGLQSVVSYIQSKPGIPKRNELNRANRCLYQCEQDLKIAKREINRLKGPSSTDEAFWKTMELQINKYWNDQFWRYISTTFIFKPLSKRPHGVYALSKLLVLDPS